MVIVLNHNIKMNMKDGDKVKLVPSISTLKRGKASIKRNRLNDLLKAMTEEVTIIKLLNISGNAKVRDSKGIVFYCNPDDLSPFFDN